MLEVRTLDDFNAFIDLAAPGDRVIYHRGFLAIDAVLVPGREEQHELGKIARAALTASFDGKAALTQRKLGTFKYEYLAERC